MNFFMLVSCLLIWCMHLICCHSGSYLDLRDASVFHRVTSTRLAAWLAACYKGMDRPSLSLSFWFLIASENEMAMICRMLISRTCLGIWNWEDLHLESRRQFVSLLEKGVFQRIFFLYACAMLLIWCMHRICCHSGSYLDLRDASIPLSNEYKIGSMGWCLL
ncbi:uncharacterized protein LOC131253089 [Magnolia sinica]|uniref:uncharacterized protein LOC131253089 n=1 Tax=Magnolia sinica TaxID=86752 RepID=UPI00265875F7|nr:uncharacterized protein LOC131253089 [Magnolia sinica]